MLTALLVAHVVVGLVVVAGARAFRRSGLVVAALPSAATVVWMSVTAPRLLRGEVVTERTGWVSQLDLAMDLRADAFSLAMLVLVSGIGLLVFVYAWSYFAPHHDHEPTGEGHPSVGPARPGPDPARVARVGGLLTVFSGAMVGLVTADHLLLLFVCWELTSITSYLLIGMDHERVESRAAATQALLTTSLGALAMLAGLIVLGEQAGTYRISEIVADPPAVSTVALVAILVGAFAKSAQYPFHSWLPAAMVAATPISAYLHSAAMVKAGIYLIARLAPTMSDAAVWRPLVLGVGLVTMIAGGLRALRPNDLKQVLAFGTISQLGFLTVLVGYGNPDTTAAGVALLVAHGLFKAPLFMVVGMIDHQLGTRDLRRLPTTWTGGWRPVQVITVLAAASMAGVAPLAGFVAKESALAALFDGGALARAALVGVVLGSALTVAYSLRIVAALVRPEVLADRSVHPGGRVSVGPAPRAQFVLPAAILAAASVAIGVAPAGWSTLVDSGSRALDRHAHAHLALWHGPTPELGLSVAILVGGVALFAVRRVVEDVAARGAPTTTGADVYDSVVARGLSFARVVTERVQFGSLPGYVAVVLVTASIAVAVALLSGDWWSGGPAVHGSLGQIPAAAVLIVASVTSLATRRRFASAVVLGGAGYGMALLFAVQGAPDVALTQFGVETLSVVAFLLVLRLLPADFGPDRSSVPVWARAGVAVLVGVVLVTMAVASGGARQSLPADVEPVSAAMAREALPEGHGRNVVNVILVDIRGLDTLGEATVVATAAIGIAALARAGRRPRRLAHGPEAEVA